MVEIWVDLIQNERGAWRPDAPQGLWWDTDEGAPSDFTDSENPHIVRKFNIIVNDVDIPVWEAALGQPVTYYNDGDPEDIMGVDMVRLLNGKQYGKQRDDAMQEFCESRTEDTQIIRNVLEHAVTRGVSPVKAEAIRVENSLPESRTDRIYESL